MLYFYQGNLKNGHLNNSHFQKKKKKITLKKKKIETNKNDISDLNPTKDS
jgi:hypothetical protein